MGFFSISPIGHEHIWGEYKYDDINHWKECEIADCNEISSSGKHSWNEGVITKEPTYTEQGEKTYTCDICGKTKIEKVDYVYNGGDSWEGIDLPQAAGASQTTTRFEHVDETLSVTATWTGSIPNNASTVTVNGVGTAYAECPAEPDISQYVEAISQANAWMSAMSDLNIEWTADSDKVVRKVTVPSLSLNQKNSGNTDESGEDSDKDNNDSLMNATALTSYSNPVTITDSNSAYHEESCGEGDTITVPDPCTAVAAPSGAGSYSITVTYTLSPHAVCGPLCEHS